MRDSLRDEGGFSLIEVMVVLLIIGVLLSISIATYTVATQRAGSVACESNRRYLERVTVSEYRREHNDPPDSVEDLAPYVSQWSVVRACPTDDSLVYFFLADKRTIVCVKHGQ